MSDPILAGPKEYTKGGQTYRITVRGGLHYIRGNSQPYFSVTADIDEKTRGGRWRDHSGGCCHDEIVRVFPSLAPLVSMHLRHMDGAASAGGGNAFYWIMGGQFFPANSWMADNTAEEKRREYVANELQLPRAESDAIFDAFKIYAISPSMIVEGRARFMREIVEPSRQRWADNAAFVIQHFGLQIYGDRWTPKAAA